MSAVAFRFSRWLPYITAVTFRRLLLRLGGYITLRPTVAFGWLHCVTGAMSRFGGYVTFRRLRFDGNVSTVTVRRLRFDGYIPTVTLRFGGYFSVVTFRFALYRRRRRCEQGDVGRERFGGLFAAAPV